MRIGILGSSFDPLHNGHLSMINRALQTGLVEEVWLMPNFENPWDRPLAFAADRFAMCKLLENKKIRVSDLEIKRGGKSYTIETVRELKRKFKDEFFWLLGSDHLKDLEQFKNSQELFKEIIFLVFPRTKISSSKIREKIKNSEPIDDLVPREIEKYIKKHRLYK